MFFESVAALDAMRHSSAHMGALAHTIGSLRHCAPSASLWPIRVSQRMSGGAGREHSAIMGSFGEVLRRYRHKRKYTQAYLAEIAGLSRRGIADLESGKRKAPYPRNEQALITALGIEGDDERLFREIARHERGGRKNAASVTEVGAVAPPTASEAKGLDPAALGDLFNLALVRGDDDLYDVPALASGAIPAVMTSIVGREHDEAAIMHALTTHRLVTLTGPGGVGKTRLAIQVAGLIGEKGTRTLFVDCSEATTPSSLLNLLARALGVGALRDMPVLRGVTAYLAAVPTLLILDNCEQAMSASAVITTLLVYAPTLCLLVTSQIALHAGGEQEYVLSPLAVPRPDDVDLAAIMAAPAVRLFVQRVQAYRASFALTQDNARAVAALCAHLDGVPLSIELVSWYARVFAPAEMLAALKRGDLIPVNRSPDAPGRHITLAETVRRSYELLADDERLFFRNLGIFAAPFTMAAAGAVCCPERTPAEASEILARLTERHLVQVIDGGEEENFFKTLNTLRAFALDRLRTEGDVARLRARHTCYYAALAAREGTRLRGPEQRAAVLSLSRALPHVRAAFEDARARGDGEVCAQIAVSTRMFWLRTADVAEGREWMRIAMDLTEGTTVPRQVQVTCAASLAIIDAFAQRGVDARTWATRAEELARATPVPYLRALALYARAVADFVAGDLDTAGHAAAASVTIIRTTTDMWSLACMLAIRASIGLAAGNVALALACCIEATALYRRLGDAQSEGWVMLTRGFTARAQGERVRALAFFVDALALADWGYDRLALLYAMESAATVAYPSVRAESAARLCGVIDRARQDMARSIAPMNTDAWPIACAELRTVLGEEAWQAERTIGATASLQEAVAAAMTFPRETWDRLDLDERQAGA